jgi:hypothetical protein
MAFPRIEEVEALKKSEPELAQARFFLSMN